MQTDAQFMHETGIPVDAIDGTPFEAFTWFDFDCGLMTLPTGEPMFPELKGRETPLFTIAAIPPATVKRLAKEDVKKAKAAKDATKAALLAGYIAKGYAFDNGAAFDDDCTARIVDDSDEGDEWERFFADDVPMQGGRCATRKGGPKEYKGFEALVDG